MKQRLFSGIQPSGNLTIGNLFGAMKNWVELQDQYESFFCIVDLHSITVPDNTDELALKSKETALLYLAAGIDHTKSTVFIQSHVPLHAHLAWILNCHTYLGELEKMTQYKEKSEKHQQRSTAGLFTYPVLMAADILLYQTHIVPVGDDQVQHLELTRDLAKRINNKYSPGAEMLKVPEYFIPEVGARIKGLQNPEKKMSKSTDNKNDSIFLLDSVDEIEKKIMKAVTDTENSIYFDEDKKPGISNLLTILSLSKNQTIDQTVKQCENMQYGEFKKTVAQALIAHIEPIQKRYYELDAQENIGNILRNGAQHAHKIAQSTVHSLEAQMGFYPGTE